jgi:hypothetical protein
VSFGPQVAGVPLALAMMALATMALAMMLVLALVLWPATVALGADASPLPSMTPLVLEGGDLRSEGEGPGLVGNPLLILTGVVLLGLATAAVTVLVLRLTDRR